MIRQFLQFEDLCKLAILSRLEVQTEFAKNDREFAIRPKQDSMHPTSAFTTIDLVVQCFDLTGNGWQTIGLCFIVNP